MTRPPPLQLEPMDTYVAAPDVPQPRIDRWSKIICGMNWKRGVIIVTVLSAVRFGIQAHSAFVDMGIDATHDMSELASISMASCLMYGIATWIQILGLVCTLIGPLPLLRLYVCLSLLVAILATATSLMDLVVFYKFVDDLVDECTSLALTGLVGIKSTFSSELWPSWKVDNEDAAEALCSDAWDATATLVPVSFVLLDLIPAILVFLVPYVYYRQLVNRSNPQVPAPTASYSPLINQSAAALVAGGGGGGVTVLTQTDMASLYSAPVTVTLHGYHPKTAAPFSAVYTPGPPSFGAPKDTKYPTYDPGLSAQGERGEFI